MKQEKGRVQRGLFIFGMTLLLTGCGFLGGGKTNETETMETTGQLEGTETVREVSTQGQAGNQEETEDTEEVSQPIEVTISATGDCTLGKTQTQGYEGSFWDYYDREGETYFFDGVRDIFQADDFTLVNLECVLTNETERVEKKWNLKGYPEYTGIMTCSGIEGCSLGNNHTLDYGEQSLVDTEEALDQAGIIYGLDDHVGYYTTEEGIMIAEVSSNALRDREGCSTYLEQGIKEARDAGADLVIVSVHWGVEMDTAPQQYQIDLGHQCIDWGADLVIGNHPHVLQGMEYYKGKVICYSLGNFCFGGNLNPSKKNTMIYQQTFTFVGGVLQEDLSASIIPCTISSTSSYNDFQPTLADQDKQAEIIEQINGYDQDLGDLYVNSDGSLQLQEESNL